MKRIGFVGFSGSGKSSLVNIAGSAGFRTVDTDAAILSKYGIEPFDAILNGNEEGFRCVESETISYCIKSDAQIFAFGGGFHYGHQCFEQTDSTGIKLVYLRNSFEELSERFIDRPLYLKLGLDEYRKLFARREPLYEKCACFTVDADKRSLNDIWIEVEKIWNLIFR